MSCFLTLQPTLPLLVTMDDITCGIEQRHVDYWSHFIEDHLSPQPNDSILFPSQHSRNGGMEPQRIPSTPSRLTVTVTVAQVDASKNSLWCPATTDPEVFETKRGRFTHNEKPVNRASTFGLTCMSAANCIRHYCTIKCTFQTSN